MTDLAAIGRKLDAGEHLTDTEREALRQAARDSVRDLKRQAEAGDREAIEFIAALRALAAEG